MCSMASFKIKNISCILKGKHLWAQVYMYIFYNCFQLPLCKISPTIIVTPYTYNYKDPKKIRMHSIGISETLSKRAERSTVRSTKLL